MFFEFRIAPIKAENPIDLIKKIPVPIVIVSESKFENAFSVIFFL